MFRRVLPKNLHVYQVRPAAFRRPPVQRQVVLRGNAPGSPLLLCAEGKQQKLVGQTVPQALQDLFHGLNVLKPLKKVRPPLHNINPVLRKTGGPVQDGLGVPVHNRDNDFGSALAQSNIPDGQ